MAKLKSYGAYIPAFRLERKEMSLAWGIPGVPGERSVAGPDEDSITMCVAAGLECLAGIDPSTLDGLYFASTTPPYSEKQCAPIVARALDMRHDIVTADFTDSLRSATVALRAANDAVESGSAGSILVVAADNRPAEPETMWEQLLGDGAAAFLVSNDGSAGLRGFRSVTSEVIGPWRSSEDRYVRAFEPKLETQYGYAASMVTVVKALVEKEGITLKDMSKAVLSGGDPRSHAGLGRQLGLEGKQLQDTGFLAIGNTGTPQVLMMLSGALDGCNAGDRVLVANYGDGADAFLVEVTDSFPAVAEKRPILTYLTTKRMLPNYGAYASFRKLMDRDRFVPNSSPVTYWRDTKMELGLYGGRCRKCGTVQYPLPRVCVECGQKDEIDEVKLARKGKVFTYTLDHLVGGEYLSTPVPRVVVDLEGGGRVFLNMADCDPDEVGIDMPVELTFRRLHSGAGFHNYYWKCQPARGS
jgi:3-hydroxy-3-methylglutaryl CoA synthase